MKKITMFLLSFGAGVIACTPSLEDYPAQLEEAYCDWQHACHQYERAGDCVESNALERDPELAYLMEAVYAGNVEYDRDAAAACLDAMRERACSYDERPAICDEVFRGRIGRNGPCMSATECAGDAVCGFDPSCTDMCCVGACRVLPDPVEIGEPCVFGGTPCVEGGYCGFDPNTGASTVCTSRIQVGGACDFSGTCVEGSQCDNGKCREIQMVGLGESCAGEFVECEPPGVCRGLDGEERTCIADAELGAPCDYLTPCARFDSFCDIDSGLCTLLPGPGQGCADFSCLPYAQCRADFEEGGGSNLARGECVMRAGPGEVCGSDTPDGLECLGALECIEGRCAFAEVEPQMSCPVPDAG